MLSLILKRNRRCEMVLLSTNDVHFSSLERGLMGDLIRGAFFVECCCITTNIEFTIL